MSTATGVLSYGAAVLVAALVTGRRGWHRRGLLVLATIVALGASLWIPEEHTLLRFVAGMLGFVVAMRAADLLRDRRRWSLGERLWLFTAVVDVRNIEPMPVRRAPRRWLAILAYATLATAGWAVAHLDVTGAWSPFVRYAGGAMFIYGIADAACGLAVEGHAALGMRLPPQHHAPILATSVGAFWSKHYNLNVSDWIARHIHRPLVRRGHARWGLAAAFGFSAAFHMWLAWIPLDLTMAASMGAFFVVQGVAVILERTLPVLRRQPVAIRRGWTLAWILLPSPLFVEPFLRIVEGQL